MTTDAEIPEEELLLPWYVSGRLEPEERARIDLALGRSPALRQALEDERKLQAAVAAAPLPVPTIGDPEALLGTVSSPEKNALPRWVKPALAAAVVLAAVEGLTLAWMVQPASYRPASGPSPRVGVELMRYAVHLTEDVSVARLRAALDEARAGIVRGPLPNGAYIVETTGGAPAIESLRRSGVAREIARTE